MSYKYNPLLQQNLQKLQDIPEPPAPVVVDNELSPISENPVQNKIITAKVEDIEQNTSKKVSKFFASVDELECGEIGQYHGETNGTYTHGYFYERGEATPAQYEDVTIPAGAKRIIYTNKFDNSQRIAYTVETVTLDHAVTTNYQQSGYVAIVDAAFKTRLYNRQSYDNLIKNYSIIQYEVGLFYSITQTFRSIKDDIGPRVLSTLQQLYSIIKAANISDGFRISTITAATVGQVIDIYAQVLLPICVYNDSAVKIQTELISIYVLASELEENNWDISQLAPSYGFPNDQRPYEWVVNTDALSNYYIEYWGNIIEANGVHYAVEPGPSAGQTANIIYRTISEDGKDNRYIDTTYLLCVYNSQPVSNTDYWAQAIDLQLYFDYNVRWETTTEAITIHRKIQQYDEYGFPLADVSTAIRRDAQPVDSELSPVSENPVQNKAVQAAIAKIDGFESFSYHNEGQYNINPTTTAQWTFDIFGYYNNKICIANFVVKTSSNSQTVPQPTTFFTLPAHLRPKATVWAWGVNPPTGNPFMIEFGTSGNINSVYATPVVPYGAPATVTYYIG